MKKVLSGHWANIPNPQHWAQLCFSCFLKISRNAQSIHNITLWIVILIFLLLKMFWAHGKEWWDLKSDHDHDDEEKLSRVRMTVLKYSSVLFFWCTTARMTVDLWVAGPQERPSLCPVLQAWASKPLNHTLGTFWNNLYRLSPSCHRVIIIMSWYLISSLYYHRYRVLEINAIFNFDVRICSGWHNLWDFRAA